MKVLLLTWLLLMTSTVQASCVILLHGLARTNSSMTALEKKLVDQGYHVINDGYPSRAAPIEELAEIVISPALEKCNDYDEINFVTHSLGGILVRQYLSQNDIPKLKYVVMLRPPSQGSEVVDKLDKVPGFRFVNGDAELQLGTGELSVPNKLGPANFDVGMIAGTQSINLILSTYIPGSDDGKVSIESTKLEGMNDHIEMATSHPFMMKNQKVLKQVTYYLANGKFTK
jgi:hypothetical protein